MSVELLQNAQLQPISAVISTRSRPQGLVEAVESVLANTHPEFELIVIDQSDDDSSRLALQPLLSDSRLRYIPSQEKGLSKGHNLAIEQARYELIAVTDDDCVVSSDWLEKVATALTSSTDIGMVVGNVIAGKHDPAKGMTPVFICTQVATFSGTSQKNQVRAIGACMGLKRTVWRQLHGFDPLLGPGALFKSAGDADFIYKVLASDKSVYQTPDIEVIHNGFRTYEHNEVRSLAVRDYFGLGAWAAKNIKLKQFSILKVIWHEMAVVAFNRVWSYFREHHRITGLRPFLAFGQGFLKGLTVPIDPVSQNFHPKSGQQAG